MAAAASRGGIWQGPFCRYGYETFHPSQRRLQLDYVRGLDSGAQERDAQARITGRSEIKSDQLPTIGGSTQIKKNNLAVSHLPTIILFFYFYQLPEMAPLK